MGTALKGGGEGGLDTGGGGGESVEQNAQERGESEGCFVFTSWPLRLLIKKEN